MNEEGFDQYYLRVADLLRRRPAVRGLAGTSWFYDPQLIRISPRLAYLQSKPIERGAFLIRHNTSALDIQRATLKSATRRDLYDKGEYVPVSYSLIWGRRELIAWSDSFIESKSG